MGKIDIKLAYEIMHHTRTYIRHMWVYWKGNVTVERALTIIVVLYQYIEAWTAIKIQQDHVREYYINKDKIGATVNSEWASYATLLHHAREQVCHNFGSVKCKNALKRFMQNENTLQRFMLYLGVLDPDDVVDAE